jgi:geranylgeranyl reductase family protein
MYNCVIVGAGPAGTTAAYHLAKKGYSVLLLEKLSLPRYKPCGGGVSPAIAQWLDFDFSPVIENTISQVEYTWQMGEAVRADIKNVQPMWMVKRDNFDNFLVTKAQEQGVEVKDNIEVTGIALAKDSWTITSNNGNYQGSYLIAADGAKGVLSQLLGFKPRQQFLGGTLEVTTEVPTEERNRACFDLGYLKHGYIWNFPKASGYTISGAYFRSKGKPEDLKKQITEYATKFGLDLNKSQYFDYHLSLWADHQTLHCDRALLAGEAAGVGDPLTGEGIRPSVFTGFRAAEAIAQALAGDSQALANYSKIVTKEWGADMLLAQRLAGVFYQFPKIAYKVGVKRPAAAQIMGKLLCGELRYGDVTEQAIKVLKKSLLPGMRG